MSLTRYVLCVLLLVFMQTESISAALRKGAWSKWGKWTDCSVRCGTGISKRERICENPYRPSMASSRVDKSLICDGPKHEIVVCNTQKCPVSILGIREEQCASYNHKIFSGKNYIWKPFINPMAPCELTCRPDGQSFYARLSERVTDGTECSLKKLAVCIRGQCVDVGCDGVVGSQTGVDKCGVCKGDNSSCQTISGIYTQNEVAVGYNKIIDIPIGSTDINITELKTSTNYLVLKNQDGSYIINGNYKITTSGEFHAAGTTIKYSKRSKSCRGECIYAAGPTNENIQLQILAYHKNPGVMYSFNVPTNVSDPYYKRILERQTGEVVNLNNNGKIETGDTSPTSVTKQQQQQKPQQPSRLLGVDKNSRQSDQGSEESVKEAMIDSKSSEVIDTVELGANYKNSIMDDSEGSDYFPDGVTGSQAERTHLTEPGAAQETVRSVGVKTPPSALRSYDKSSFTVNHNKPQHDSAHTSSRSFSRIRRPLFSQSFTFRDRFRPHVDNRRREHSHNRHSSAINIHDTGRFRNTNQHIQANSGSFPSRQQNYNQQRQSYYDRRTRRPTAAPQRPYYPTSAQRRYPTPRPRVYPTDSPVSRDSDETTRSQGRYNYNLHGYFRKPYDRVTIHPPYKHTALPKVDIRLTSGPNRYLYNTPTTSKYSEITTGTFRQNPVYERKTTEKRQYIETSTTPTTIPTQRPIVVHYRTRASKTTERTTLPPTSRKRPSDSGSSEAVVTLGANSKYQAVFDLMRKPPRENPHHQTVSSGDMLTERNKDEDDTSTANSGYSENNEQLETTEGNLKDDNMNVENNEYGKTSHEDTKHKTEDVSILQTNQDKLNIDGIDMQLNNKENIEEADNGYTESDNSDEDYYDVEEYDDEDYYDESEINHEYDVDNEEEVGENNEGYDKVISPSTVHGSNYGPFDQAIDPLKPGLKYDQQYLQTDLHQANPNLRQPIIQPPPPQYGTVIPRHSAYQESSNAALTGASSYSRSIVPNRIDIPNAVSAIALPDRQNNEILGSLYVWRMSGFSDCTTTCGGGLQQTIVVCVDTRTQAVVTNENCQQVERPAAKAVTCNSRPCPARWEMSEWSSCSTTCGSGIQSRTVICISRISPTVNLTMSNDRCVNELKPDAKQTCEVDACYTWSTGNWSRCSTNCGEGMRRRDVRCSNYNGHTVTDDRCTQIKPDVEELCDLGACGKGWFSTEWPQECPSTCGEGLKKRKIHCAGADGSAVSEDKCDRLNKPEESKSCRADTPCGGDWFTGNWGKCNATCGSAYRLREIVCVKTLPGGVTAVVSEGNCKNVEKPSSLETCDLEDCQPEWYISDWSECSKTCDTGVKTRKVKCLDGNQQVSANCDTSKKPRIRDSCNSRKCAEDSDTTPSLKQSGDDNCKDSFSQCSLVTKARLCRYSYYKKMCCQSCKSES
ncbi:uncharacterized protein LOC126819637 [Patella vulgata]|uniref:uncharacterized protein LOC126819637 n=1 Tax=Patella vulgata TaxID=6465 RepID=UPI0024A83D2C|nr:uncharacterized protein LOC126819637 [Patella vulgata]